MLARVKLYYSQEFTIDLEDYGASDDDVRFEDLPEDVQSEITDSLRDDAIVSCDVTTIID